jgi:hypothetical protein
VRARDEAATSELVDRLLAIRADKAAADAQEIRTLADAATLVEEQRSRLTSHASLHSDLPRRTMVAELAVASRVSERTIQRQLDDAADLCDRFPTLVDALGAARISRSHVAVIHDAGSAIDDAEAREHFVSDAIRLAESMTPGRLRPIVQILASRVDPRSMQERHDAARAQRMVRVVDCSDGIAALTLTAEAVLVHGIYDRVTHDARTVIAGRPGAGGSSDPEADPVARDDRTMDQLRADIVTDLLLTGRAESCSTGNGLDAITATVQITLPVLTAIGTGDEPALLAGFGPIDPETARRLAAGSTDWERVMTSPVTGAVLAVDRYRPCEALRRFLGARDERCRFPGCRQPVWRCDIDHTIDAAHGGPTCSHNLAHLCRGHHVLKHNSHWSVRQLEGGVLEWTSPTGRVYTDLPEPVVRFIPEPPRPRMDFSDPLTWPGVDEGDPPDF